MTKQERFDVIVVGAGVAGSATAIRLMQQNPDLSVALIDRGSPIGSKNVSGGVLWGQNLEALIPQWWEKAPIERKIVQKRTGLLTKKDAFTVDFHFPHWEEDSDTGAPNAVSLLLGKFVNWLAKEAENVGAEVYEGITVDNVTRDINGSVNGIIQEGDKFEADVVILADGANSRISLASGLRKEMKKEHFALAVKEILYLPEERINDRFNNISSSNGLAAEYLLSDLPSGIQSGGFLYTNKDSLSLGVVIQIDTLNDPSFPPIAVYNTFKEHPHIRNLIEGAESIQYSAHWVPEGGYHMLPTLYDDGIMVVGDAAGFVLSNGMVIQGLNYAIESGIKAADTYIEARNINNYSKKILRNYEKKLKQGVLKDLKRFKNVHKITRNPRLYNKYPNLLLGVFDDMLTERGAPKKQIISLFRNRKKIEKVGWIRLLRDAITFRHF